MDAFDIGNELSTMSHFFRSMSTRGAAGLALTVMSVQASSALSCSNASNPLHSHQANCSAGVPKNISVYNMQGMKKPTNNFEDQDDGSFGHTDLSNLCLVAGHGHPALAAQVAEIIGVPLASTKFKSFSDGECFIQFDENIRGQDVFVIQSCSHPVNDTIMELLLTISCARRSGARRVIAVVPYFGYKHHRRGYQISTKHQSRFLSSGAIDFGKMLQEMGVDRVISVDLQRPGQGQEACFLDVTIPLEVVITMDLLVQYFLDNVPLEGPITVLTPNAECFKKARKFQLELEKGLDREVKLAAYFPKGTGSGPVGPGKKPSFQLEGNDTDVKGKNVIIVDDMIDTAGTLSYLSDQLEAAGAKNVYVVASHGLFTASSMKLIENSKSVKRVFVTDSLPMNLLNKSDKVTQVGIAPMLANVIQAEYFRWEDDEQEGMQKATGQLVED